MHIFLSTVESMRNRGKRKPMAHYKPHQPGNISSIMQLVKYSVSYYVPGMEKPRYK